MPPVAVTVIVPSLRPQSITVVDTVLQTKSSNSVMVTLHSVTQPFASVTTIVYSPAAKLLKTPLVFGAGRG